MWKGIPICAKSDNSFTPKLTYIHNSKISLKLLIEML